MKNVGYRGSYLVGVDHDQNGNCGIKSTRNCMITLQYISPWDWQIYFTLPAVPSNP